MKRWQRSLHFLPTCNKSFKDYRCGISLHGHTNLSQEGLGFVNHHIDTVPIVAHIARHALARYRREHGEDLDFNRAYWTAPLSPSEAHELERKQIENALGLEGIVSLTDHDTIGDALEWQGEEERETVISLEWTLPYGPISFHFGVHNLPRTKAREITRQLLSYTEQPDENQLPELLAMLDRIPTVLLVLNHPFWGEEFVGSAIRHEMLLTFVRHYGAYIHALEVSGLRPWSENLQALQLAEGLCMPVISGGDRHGLEASTMLNLTRAESFSEFVAEIRQEGRSNIVVMPSYQQPFGLRMMQVAWDILRDYPAHPGGRRCWTDRVFFECDDGAVRPLSRCFKDGLPKELRLLVGAMMRLEQQPWHTLLRAAWTLHTGLGAAAQRETRKPAARPSFPGSERSVA